MGLKLSGRYIFLVLAVQLAYLVQAVKEASKCDAVFKGFSDCVVKMGQNIANYPQDLDDKKNLETICRSNCDLDYELYKDDLPYRCWPRRSIPLSPLHQRDLPKQVRAKRCTKSLGIYEYQKIPPLIGHIPIKIRRSHLGTESKIRLSPHRDLRSNSNPTTGRTKLRAEELHSIKGELSQIKAQVDNLLESLNRMDQQREHPTGAKERERKPFAGMDASYPAGELTRMKGSVRNEGQAPQQEVNSAEESTDTEEAAVKNHTPDPEGSK